MKNISFFVIAIFISFAFYSCDDTEQNEQIEYEFKEFNGNVTLKTQTEVIEFGNNNYTKLNGYLQIGDWSNISEVTDLTPLLSINTITGDDENESLVITKNENLENIYGLNNLTSLSGMIVISDNNSLKMIDALSNLSGVIESTTEPSGLYIHNNPNLENLNGLENITGMGSMLIIRQNTKLTNLQGLNNVTTNFAEVEIRNNFHLENLDALSNSTFSHLSITDNVNLVDFCGVYQFNDTYGYQVYGNAYNPTLDDLLNGNCSQ